MVTPGNAPAASDPWALNAISFDVTNIIPDRQWLVVVSWWHLGADRNAADALLDVRLLRTEKPHMMPHI